MKITHEMLDAVMAQALKQGLTYRERMTLESLKSIVFDAGLLRKIQWILGQSDKRVEFVKEEKGGVK